MPRIVLNSRHRCRLHLKQDANGQETWCPGRCTIGLYQSNHSYHFACTFIRGTVGRNVAVLRQTVKRRSIRRGACMQEQDSAGCGRKELLWRAGGGLGGIALAWLL